MFGKADPYCRLRIGTQEFTTKHNPGGGKNPIWNEEFAFDISSEREIEFEVSLLLEAFAKLFDCIFDVYTATCDMRFFVRFINHCRYCIIIQIQV